MIPGSFLPDRSSLTARLSLTLSLIVIAVLGIVILALALRLGTEQDTLLDRSLEWQAKDIAVHLERLAGGRNVGLNLPPELAQAYNRADGQYLYLISDSAGAALFYSRYGEALAGHLPDAQSPAAQLSYFEFQNLQLNQTFYGATLLFWVGDEAFIVQVAQGPVHSDVLFDALIEEFVEQQWWAALLFLVAIIGAVILTVRTSLAPIERVARIARELGPTSLDARLETEGVPTEVLPIVDAFNLALARIEQGYMRQREFTANAAHQLRTPLTILRADLENERFDRVAALSEVRALERLVHQFLHLAQADNFQMASDEVADLRQIAEDTVSALAPVALRVGQEIELDAPEHPVLIRGSASFIGVALRNLVENGLTYSPKGKRVCVKVAAPGSVSVIDQGAGIPASQREQIFTRFWRADRRAEDGAGLGLSIVAQIVESHKGGVLVNENPMGGTIFTLEFPPASNISEDLSAP